MKTKLIIFVIVLITSVGCATNLKSTEIPPIATQTPIFVSTPTEVSSTTNTPPTFQIEYLNPTNHIITISELNLDTSTRILAFDQKSQQIVSISDQTVTSILKPSPDSIVDSKDIILSPDHYWFAYLEINDGFNIWISSVDGSHHFESQTNTIGSSFRWINNDQIVVYNKTGLWMDCPNELRIFNPFTGATKDVPYVDYKYCFPIPIFNEDSSKALFLDSQKGWELYDYKSNTLQPVLEGLDISPSSNKYNFHWEKEGLKFALPASSKISFVQNLPDEVLEKKVSLKEILLPADAINENENLAFWIPDIQLVGFDLVGVNKKSVLNCEMPKTFVIANLMTKELKVYCMDQSVFSSRVGAAWSTYVSANNRFAGWTVRELQNNDKLLGTVILDIETGKISYLDGYEFLGFGEISP